MSQPKEPKNQSRPSSVGGSKLGIEVKVKKDAPKSKLGQNANKGSPNGSLIRRHQFQNGR